MDRTSIRRKLEKLMRNLKRTRSPSRSDSSPERAPSPKRCCRRRIISTDSSEPEPANENINVANEQQNEVETDDVFSLLGEDPTQNKEYSEDIHAHLAVRWTHILSKGLKKELRSDLLKKYLPPANCTFLEAPKLNEEIKAAVIDSSVKRDEKLVIKQSQLGSGITCLGRALDIAFKIPDKQSRDLIIIHLGEAGQILCDLHYLDTITRRSLLTNGLNKNTKDAVKDLTRDKLLFGESLTETLKAVKACSRSASDIKNKPAKSAQRINDSTAGPSTHRTASNSLNWRGPSRRTAYPAMTTGGYRDRRQSAAAPARRQYNRNSRHPSSTSAKRY